MNLFRQVASAAGLLLFYAVSFWKIFKQNRQNNANERTAVKFSLSPGNEGDAPCGRALL